MTETAEDYELFHYGVKGMKWGVRKRSNTATAMSRYSEIRNRPLEVRNVVTKTGYKLRIEEEKTPRIPSAILAVRGDGLSSLGYRSYKFKNSDGKTVGDAAFKISGKDELYLDWLGVKKSARGNGIATSAFDLGIAKGREYGVNKLTLEVPGDSPDAKHIYTKAGFKDDGPVEDYDPKDMWGGLTKMSMEINSVKHSEDDDIEDVVLQMFEDKLRIAEDNLAFGHADASPEDYELFHYGVKGMKWGVRKKQSGGVKTSRMERKLAERSQELKLQSRDHKDAQKLRKKPLEQMSNEDIKKLNKRLELETNYARLMESTRKKNVLEKGLDFVTGVSRQADRAANVYNSPSTNLGKKIVRNVRN